MKDKKGNVFNLDDVIQKIDDTANVNQNFAVPNMSHEAILILNAVANSQMSLNSIVTQISAYLYAMRKTNAEIFGLMQTGVKISEYVNRQYQIDQYRSSANQAPIDLGLLSKMNEAITKIENELLEKGVEYIDDAKAEYQRFLDTQKG